MKNLRHVGKRRALQIKIYQNQAGCYVYDVTKVKTAYYFYVSALIYCQSFHSYYS